MRDLRSVVACSLAAILSQPVAATLHCDAARETQEGCSSLLKAELAQEEAATDYRFELLQRDMKRNEAIKTAEQPQKGEVHEEVPITTRRAPPLSLVTLATSESASEQRPAIQGGPPWDCEKFPFFCRPEVDCPGMTKEARMKQKVKIATDDGHANYQSWCAAYSSYAETIPLCLFGEDKIEFAKMMYQEQLGLGATEVDAFYCFGSGHCNNTQVTLDTTVPESEEICTDIFGNEWKNVGWEDFRSSVKAVLGLMSEGYISSAALADAKSNTGVLAMAACAQGNFACDNIYCKENYCDNPSYRRQYGWAAWAL